MDHHMFEDYLSASSYLQEANSYLEIFNYSNPHYNTNELHSLEDSEILNFIHQRGAFTPANVPADVHLISSVRILLQIDAKQTLTFDPAFISLPHDIYRDLVHTFHLSSRWIETSAAVGTLFWHTIDKDEEDPIMQIVYRKSDVVKKTKTRGWEIALSHDVRRSSTLGFFKGTNSSDIRGVVAHLRRCAAEVGHALTIPMIIFGHDMGQSMERKQREIRHLSRKLENAISLRGDINPDEGFVVNGIVDYDVINQHIIECSTQVMWKNPKSYKVVLEGFRRALSDYWVCSEIVHQVGSEPNAASLTPILFKLHKSLLGRVDFYMIRLEGIKEYMETTTKRLEVQRHALEMNTSRRESKLNLEIAFQQRQLIHNTKRETEGQKTIATLGVIFLPPTVISGIFSTSFFNFQSNDPEGERVVSSYFWVFWAITIPITALIFTVFILYDWYRQAQDKLEDAKIAQSVDELERRIQREMRVATIARLDTFQKKDDGTRGMVGGSVVVHRRRDGAKEWAGDVKDAMVDKSGRAGASIWGTITNTFPIRRGTRKRDEKATAIQSAHQLDQPVMGEAMLHAPIELRPSGKMSLHSRSPSRERPITMKETVNRPNTGASSTKAPPSITISSAAESRSPDAIRGISRTFSSDEELPGTRHRSHTDIKPQIGQPGSRSKENLGNGTIDATVHFEADAGDRVGRTHGVNGRQYGLGWLRRRSRERLGEDEGMKSERGW